MRHPILAGICWIALCFVVAMPQSTAAQSTTVEAQYRATLLQLITALEEQITALRAELERRQATPVATFERPELPYQSVREYDVPVTGNDLTLRRSADEDFFERVLELTPAAYRDSLAGLIVYDGRSQSSDAYVYGQKHSSGSFRWFFGVNDEAIRSGLYDDSRDELIVHELGHIVGLRDALKPGANFTCHEAVATGASCPDPDSTLGEFIDRFWTETLLDELAESSSRFRGNRVRGFGDSFVSDYASSNPNEDFAESFMVYVLGRGDDFDSAVTRAKIAFFDQYPQYRAVKAEILNRI